MANIDDTVHDNAVKPNQSESGDPDQKPTNLELVFLLMSVFLSMFLVAVDRTIISTVRYTPLNRASIHFSRRAATPCADLIWPGHP